MQDIIVTREGDRYRLNKHDEIRMIAKALWLTKMEKRGVKEGIPSHSYF